MTGKRNISLNLCDAHIGIWQDNPNDPTFRTEIFGPLVRFLRDGGWTVGVDPTVRCYRTLRPTHRLAGRGAVRAALGLCGRTIKIDLWSEAAPLSNRNGRRYDFGRQVRAPYLDRLRMDLMALRITAWLRGRAEVSVEDRRHKGPGAAAGQISAEAFIADRRAKCWHLDKDLGRARYTNGDWDRTSGDKLLIDDGAQVWFVGPKGRILRGIAAYDLNNRWMVRVGRYGVHFLSCWEIFVRRPDDLRRKRNERERRGRLEKGISAAIRGDDFARAELLRRILFGDAPTFRIWSRKHSCFYAPNFSGYRTDGIDAGRYTREEAESEVRRVPHILELVMPDGRHVAATDLDTARAA